ncbi:ATPase [Stutzerimonas kirkiae]|nr:ATPase [Stutzerimonas kirkiae]
MAGPAANSGAADGVVANNGAVVNNGAVANNGAAANNNEALALKSALHRHLIEALEDEHENLLESPRPVLSRFVADRSGDYIRRRQLAISRYEIDQLTEELVDELTGFGPLEVLLRDPAVTEILVNGPLNIFIERGGVLHQSGLRFMDDGHLLRVIQRILAPLGRRLDESSPMVDARLPDGSRVNAVIPPVALDGPCLSVRKFRRDMHKGTDLLASRSLSAEMLAFLEFAVQRRCNLLVSGGTGTGKTTLLNLLSQFIAPRERIVTIEDTAELQLGHAHVVRLETRPPNADGHGEVTARALVRNALRMRPDRIILGEIRGVEVLDVLAAMNTGHDGSMSTLHANNALDALLRLEGLVSMSGIQVPERTLRRTICAAIDMVVQLTRLADGRRCVSEILEVVEVRDSVFVTNTLFRLDRRNPTVFVREAAAVAGEKLKSDLTGVAR